MVVSFVSAFGKSWQFKVFEDLLNIMRTTSIVRGFLTMV